MSAALPAVPPGWIQTASGLPFWPLAPRVQDVRIEDIAHALAAMNRYGGHARRPYSVAQHSVYCAREMERRALALDADHEGVARWGLCGIVHDATEAYLVDVPRPVKRQPTFAAYREAEAAVHTVILAAFGLDLDGYPAGEIAIVDRQLLRTEQAQLMPPAILDEQRDDAELLPIKIVPWGFARARREFLAAYARLEKARR